MTEAEKAANLIIELFDVVAKYDGTITTSTVVGVLEMLKLEIIHNEFKLTAKDMANAIKGEA